MRTARWTTALAAGLLAAGCGTAATGSARPPAPVTLPAVQPANPVPVLRLTGAAPDKGEVYGHAGLENDQVAHGTFPGGEEVFVFTYATAALRAYWLAHPVLPPQDGEYHILGPQISLITVDTMGSHGDPTPQQVAVQVGGTLLPVGS